jgi:hypothetical protein
MMGMVSGLIFIEPFCLNLVASHILGGIEIGNRCKATLTQAITALNPRKYGLSPITCRPKAGQ